MNPRRLYRSRDRQLAGVAGGMAEYLDVDPTIIRIAWILVAIASGGLALIAYLLLALVIPNTPYPIGAAGAPWPGQPGAWTGQPGGPGTGQSGPAWGSQPGPAWSGQPAAGTAWSNSPAYGTGGWAVPPTSAQWPPQAATSRFVPARQTRGLGAAGIVGIVLVVIGAIALLDVVLPGLRFGLVLGPAVILALGAALLVSSIRRTSEPSATAPIATNVSSGAPADAGAQSAWSGVPTDVTPWPTTAAPAPARPAEPQAAQPDAATPTTHPVFDGDETTIDPA